MKILLRILSIAPLSADRAQLDRTIDSLPFGKKEAEELHARKHRPALTRSLGVRLALWDLLKKADLPPRPMLRTPEGKPYFEGDSVSAFSLSHTESFAVAALSTEEIPIGVDVEQLSARRKTDALARRYFSSEELTRWENAPNKDLEFLRIWTQKEAYAKCDGRGLSLLLGNESRPSYCLRTFLLQKDEAIAVLTLCSPIPMEDVTWYTDKDDIQIQELF